MQLILQSYYDNQHVGSNLRKDESSFKRYSFPTILPGPRTSRGTDTRIDFWDRQHFFNIFVRNIDGVKKKMPHPALNEDLSTR